MCQQSLRHHSTRWRIDQNQWSCTQCSSCPWKRCFRPWCRGAWRLSCGSGWCPGTPASTSPWLLFLGVSRPSGFRRGVRHLRGVQLQFIFSQGSRGNRGISKLRDCLVFLGFLFRFLNLLKVRMLFVLNFSMTLLWLLLQYFRL